MKKTIALCFLVLFLVEGCATTKEVIIKDWTGTTEKPTWDVGEKWFFAVKDSGGNYREDIVEYIGLEEKQDGIYRDGKFHVFLLDKRRKRFFTKDFHWVSTLIKEKEGWRDYEFFDPPNKYFEFPLQVGKSWKHDVVFTRITGEPPIPRTGKCVKERKVLEYVKIEVKGKPYEAYKIEENCLLHKTRQVLWYSPSVKNWVKRVWYNADGSWWQEELTNYEPK